MNLVVHQRCYPAQRKASSPWNNYFPWGITTYFVYSKIFLLSLLYFALSFYIKERFYESSPGIHPLPLLSHICQNVTNCKMEFKRHLLQQQLQTWSTSLRAGLHLNHCIGGATPPLSRLTEDTPMPTRELLPSVQLIHLRERISSPTHTALSMLGVRLA